MSRDQMVSISKEMERILQSYEADLTEDLARIEKEAGKIAKQRVIELSPENLGEYKRGWAASVKRGKYTMRVTVHNKKVPQLTHLLEESHVVKNQYGTYERTDPESGRGGKKHIGPAEEAGMNYLLAELKKL